VNHGIDALEVRPQGVICIFEEIDDLRPWHRLPARVGGPHIDEAHVVALTKYR
jgi:hypothetical protein